MFSVVCRTQEPPPSTPYLNANTMDNQPLACTFTNGGVYFVSAWEVSIAGLPWNSNGLGLSVCVWGGGGGEDYVRGLTVHIFL